MTRANLTIVILGVLILILGGLCYSGKPLYRYKYTPEMGKIIDGIEKTGIGGKIILHYRHRLEHDKQLRIGPARDLTEKDVIKTYFLLFGQLFTVLVALVGFIASMALFVINGADRQPPVSKVRMAVIVIMVLLAGTLIRLMLGMVMYGNYDMKSYEIVTKIILQGGNVYEITPRYNYSPVWFTVLYILARMKMAMPNVPSHFVVKAFLCCIDLLTLGVLLLIAGIRKLPASRTAIFFYLSPVSFLLTGYHGQFENFALLMVLIGIFMFLWLADRPVLKTILLWVFATAGMIVKHNTFYELIICLNYSIKRYWLKAALFLISVALFISLFIPFWKKGSEGIIQNVFMYGSESGSYGVTSLIEMSYLKYIFVLAISFFPLILRSRDIIAQCLLGALFFLTFTTGFAVQYFILPVALGALRPTKFFLLYTVVASLLILGDSNNVFIPGLDLLKLNFVWIAVIFWFVAEMRLDSRSAGIAASH